MNKKILIPLVIVFVAGGLWGASRFFNIPPSPENSLSCSEACEQDPYCKETCEQALVANETLTIAQCTKKCKNNKYCFNLCKNSINIPNCSNQCSGGDSYCEEQCHQEFASVMQKFDLTGCKGRCNGIELCSGLCTSTKNISCSDGCGTDKSCLTICEDTLKADISCKASCDGDPNCIGNCPAE